MNKYYLLIILLIKTSLLFSEENKLSDLSIITENAKLGDMIISKGKINYTYEWIRMDSTNAEIINYEKGKSYPLWKNYDKKDIVYYFNGIKQKSEISYLRYFSDSETDNFYDQSTNKKRVYYKLNAAYNGEKTDALYFFQIEHGILTPQAEIFPGNEIFRITDQYSPLYYANSINGTPISSFLNGNYSNQKLNNFHQIGEEILGNQLCEVFNGTIANSDTTITIWLLSQCAYRPKKISINYTDGEKIINNKFVQNPNGIWYSIETSIDNYYLKENEKKLYSREIIKINNISLNEEVPTDTFEINFMTGMNIFDRRLDKMVKWGK
jgi:hypothetical protein